MQDKYLDEAYDSLWTIKKPKVRPIPAKVFVRKQMPPIKNPVMKYPNTNDSYRSQVKMVNNKADFYLAQKRLMVARQKAFEAGYVPTGKLAYGIVKEQSKNVFSGLKKASGWFKTRVVNREKKLYR